MRVTQATAFWPYQVRRLLDGGWTVEDLARALKATPERVHQYTTGRAIPEHHTQRDLLRLLSNYRKRARAEGRQAPPRLVEENDLPRNAPARPAKPARGVYREEVTPAGETWYKVVLSNGKVGTIHLPTELVDPQFSENLWRRLDALDPVQLRAVK